MSDTLKTSNTMTVRINQQQQELLERLRQEGAFGDTVDEVVLNLFRAHARQIREGKE